MRPNHEYKETAFLRIQLQSRFLTSLQKTVGAACLCTRMPTASYNIFTKYAWDMCLQNPRSMFWLTLNVRRHYLMPIPFVLYQWDLQFLKYTILKFGSHFVDCKRGAISCHAGFSTFTPKAIKNKGGGKLYILPNGVQNVSPSRMYLYFLQNIRINFD